METTNYNGLILAENRSISGLTDSVIPCFKKQMERIRNLKTGS